MLATASLVGLLPQVILGPFTGTLVDRWSRRLTMILADSLIAFATVLLAILFALRSPELDVRALTVVAGKLKPLAGQNGKGIAAMASTRLTAEALHEFRQLFGASMFTAEVDADQCSFLPF